MLLTITVNQWVIKANAENGRNDPAICIHGYVDRDRGDWGEWVFGPVHTHEFTIPTFAREIKVIHSSEFKTPCGASCWMEFVV